MKQASRKPTAQVLPFMNFIQTTLTMYNVWSMYSYVYLNEYSPEAYRGHSSQHLHSLAVCIAVA